MKEEKAKDTLYSLMESLPEEAQSHLAKVLMIMGAGKPLNIIKGWMEKFESHDPIDVLIAQIVGQVITKVGSAITEELKELRKKEEYHYTGKDAGLTALKQLKEIIETMEHHLNHEQCNECINKND